MDNMIIERQSGIYRALTINNYSDSSRYYCKIMKRCDRGEREKLFLVAEELVIRE